MAENEKQSIQRMADAMEGLPEEKSSIYWASRGGCGRHGRVA